MYGFNPYTVHKSGCFVTNTEKNLMNIYNEKLQRKCTKHKRELL
jgi:hypothetical protein